MAGFIEIIQNWRLQNERNKYIIPLTISKMKIDGIEINVVEYDKIWDHEYKEYTYAERYMDTKFEFINFVDTSLSNCVFQNSIFRKVNFFGFTSATYIEDCVFKHCRFVGIDFPEIDGDSFENCEFKDCHLPHPKDLAKNNDYLKCTFTNCVFESIDHDNFVSCKMLFSKFSRTTLDTSRFRETEIINSSFELVGFKGDKLDRLKFINCDISHGIDLRSMTITSSIFRSTMVNINDSSVNESVFEDCRLSIDNSLPSFCNFSRSNVTSIGSRFIDCRFDMSAIGNTINCEFENTSFVGANLTMARFQKCKFNNVDFTNVEFETNPQYSHNDSLSFITVNLNVIGFQKLTYCLEEKQVYLLWDYDEFVNANAIYINDNRPSDYSTSFSQKTIVRSYKGFKTLTTTLDGLKEIVTLQFLSGKIWDTPLMKLNLFARKISGSFSLPEKGDLKSGHIQMVGQRILDAIEFMERLETELALFRQKDQ